MHNVHPIYETREMCLEYLREAADRASFVDVHVEKSILNLK